MDDGLTTLLIILLLIAAVVLWIRKIMGMHKRGLDHGEEALEGMKKRIALDEEILAQNRRLVEQGDETIALLNAIKDNLEHRSIKN